jgi:hypothetical protein
VNRRLAFLGAPGIILAIVGLAFAVAPRSCEGGLELYFRVGALALVGLFALPFMARAGGSVLSCLAYGFGFGFGVLGAGAWLAGMVLANIRIICRLF